MTRILTLLFTSLCCLSALPAQTGTPSTYFQTLVKDAKTRIREISPKEFGNLQTASPSTVVIDVREDNEWDTGRIPGAIHVGRGILEANIESKVPQKSTPILLYCRSGSRSAVAADVLTKMGYTSVASLAGGIVAYQAAGLPVDKPAPPK